MLDNNRPETGTETMIDTDCKQEAEELMDFVGMLNSEERKEFRSFIRGAKFAVSIAAGSRQPA